MSEEKGNPHLTKYRRWLGYALCVGGAALTNFGQTTIGAGMLGLGFLLVVFHRKK